MTLDDPAGAIAVGTTLGQPGVVEVDGPTVVEPSINALQLSLAISLATVCLIGIIWLVIRFRSGDGGGGEGGAELGHGSDIDAGDH